MREKEPGRHNGIFYWFSYGMNKETEKFSIDFLIKLIRNSHEKEPGGSQADPEGCSIDVIIKFKRKLTEKEPGRHKGIFDWFSY